MTRDVFEKTPVHSDFKNPEWLNLWVPTNVELIHLLRPEYRHKLKKISDTEFAFSGKRFKFLVAKDERVFARTKEKLWILPDFIEQYKEYVGDSSSLGHNLDSYSYSQMYIEEADYR